MYKHFKNLLTVFFLLTTFGFSTAYGTYFFDITSQSTATTNISDIAIQSVTNSTFDTGIQGWEDVSLQALIPYSNGSVRAAKIYSALDAGPTLYTVLSPPALSNAILTFSYWFTNTDDRNVKFRIDNLNDVALGYFNTIEQLGDGRTNTRTINLDPPLFDGTNLWIDFGASSDGSIFLDDITVTSSGQSITITTNVYSYFNLTTNSAGHSVFAVTNDNSGGDGGGVITGNTAIVYVDFANGNDNNTGTTINSPFKHAPGDINATGNATNILTPNTTVNFKGGVQYVGGLTVNWSGTNNAPITYEGSPVGWGNGKSIITYTNGTGVTVGIIGDNKSYINIDGFEFTDIGGYSDGEIPPTNGCATTSTLARAGTGIDFTTGGSFLRISNCYFHELGEWHNQSPFSENVVESATGIKFQNVTNVIVDGCTFTKVSVGVGVKVNGGGTTTNVTIRNSEIFGYMVWGIDTGVRAPNCTLTDLNYYGNRIHDYSEYDSANWQGCGLNPHTDGMFLRTDYTGTVWRNVSLYANTFYDGQTNGAGTAAIYLTEGPSANIFNNKFIGTLHGRTIYLAGGSLAGASSQKVVIANNTFWGKHTAINLQESVKGLGTVEILNNIMHDERVNDGNAFLVFVESSNCAPSILDYNIYRSKNNANLLMRWNQKSGSGNVEWGYSDMQAYGWETHGLTNGNIGFVSTNYALQTAGAVSNNFHLLASSPAIGVATNLSMYFTNDFDNLVRDSWDMGAYKDTNITISSGSSNFVYTGSDQTFTVPTGVTSITVKAWGAGGAGGDSAAGAAGGYSKGDIATTSGESLTIIVGGGGHYMFNGTAPSGGYGGGGAGGMTAGNGASGSGGGRSAIRRSSTELLTAGGGGGNGDYNGTAGAGGGTNGNDALGSGAGGGGKQNIGGDGGIAIFSGVTGTQYTGGNAGGSYTGGGGGGYYGGGGGGQGGGFGGAGGGGSGYIDGAINTTIITGSGTTPPNTGDSDYASNVGIGGGLSSAGGNGRIVISW